MWRDRNPGNDFDKVTVRRPTTPRIEKKLPIAANMCPPHSCARQKVYIGNTRSTRFSGSVQSPNERRVGLPSRHGVVKSSSSSDGGVGNGGGVRSRFTYLRETRSVSVSPLLSARSHNSPSGDPYPTNFQIINISVAALLRAS